jgi:hypothetical protein
MSVTTYFEGQTNFSKGGGASNGITRLHAVAYDAYEDGALVRSICGSWAELTGRAFIPEREDEDGRPVCKNCTRKTG